MDRRPTVSRLGSYVNPGGIQQAPRRNLNERWWFRLHEKGGKRHEVPAHHNAEAYMDAYITSADIADDKKGPLFRSVNKHRQLTENPMTRTDVLRMIKRRALSAGLPYST